MATVRTQQETQGHIVEDYYLYFADDLVGLEMLLPDYLSHPQSYHINKCIEKLSAPIASAPLPYDPRGHSFQTTKLNNDTELNHAFFFIAAEYVKSLKLKTMSWQQLKEKMTEAFNPYVVRKGDKRVVVHTKPFAPLSFDTFLNYVIPHVVVLQGKRYLDGYSQTQKEETTLECRLVEFAADIKKAVARLNIQKAPDCVLGKDEFHSPEYQAELLRDLTQAMWDHTFLQKRQLQFSSQDAFLKYIVSFFETGGELYERYTKPLTKYYKQLSYKQATKEFFPALLFKVANESDLSISPIERGLCLTTEYPQAPLVNFSRSSAQIAPPKAISVQTKATGLNALIQENYIQKPEADTAKVVVSSVTVKKQGALAPESNSQVMARNVQKIANSLVSFFAAPKKQEVNPKPVSSSAAVAIVSPTLSAKK